MAHVVLVDVLITVALLLVWYLGFTQYNRRKGAQALRLVEAACTGSGRVIESHWISGSRLRARLRVASQWIEDASVTVRLRPRSMPVQWALSLWRGQEETVTFEADLDYVPSFNLEVFRHRWFTQNSPSDETGTRNWMMARLNPVVLTTRGQWNQDMTPVVNTLLSSRGHKLTRVRLRAKSPQLSATVPLQTLSDEQASAGFFDVVRDLAAGPASRQ